MTGDFFKVLATHKDSWIPRDLPDDLEDSPNKPGAPRGPYATIRGVIFVEKRPLYSLHYDHLPAPRGATEKKAIRQNFTRRHWRMFDRIAPVPAEYGRVISPGNSSK